MGSIEILGNILHRDYMEYLKGRGRGGAELATPKIFQIWRAGGVPHHSPLNDSQITNHTDVSLYFYSLDKSVRKDTFFEFHLDLIATRLRANFDKK